MDQNSRRVWAARNQRADNTRPQHRSMSTPFLDKFSPEVRAIIYEHVFGPCKAVTPATWITRKLNAGESQSVTDKHFFFFWKVDYTPISSLRTSKYTPKQSESLTTTAWSVAQLL
jgi:hypothetical protein